MAPSRLPSHRFPALPDLAGLAEASETPLDEWLVFLDHLSDRTGVAVDELMDLMGSTDGPMAAMVLAGYLQEAAPAGPQDRAEPR